MCFCRRLRSAALASMAVGILVLIPGVALGATTKTATESPPGSQTSAGATSPSDVLPPSSPAIDPATLQVATGLLNQIRSASLNLDQLESKYLLATTEVSRAHQAVQAAQSELATTTAQVQRISRAAQSVVVGLYMSNDIQENELSQFLSEQAATGKQTSNVYRALVAVNLANELAKLTQLRALDQIHAAAAASEANLATGAEAQAQKELGAAQGDEAQLLMLVSTQSEHVKAALDQLEAQGNASVAALLQSGDPSLRPGVADPPAPLPQAQIAVLFALAQVGKPYLWGGTGPDAFDCSGLVQQAWSAAGISLPRVAADQFAATIPISFQDLQPGDLVFFENPVGHVGIYVGNGQMIDAPYTGAQIRLDSIFWSDIAGFGRVKAS